MRIVNPAFDLLLDTSSRWAFAGYWRLPDACWRIRYRRKRNDEP